MIAQNGFTDRCLVTIVVHSRNTTAAVFADTPPSEESLGNDSDDWAAAIFFPRQDDEVDGSVCNGGELLGSELEQ